jgi:hypothetical protein
VRAKGGTGDGETQPGEKQAGNESLALPESADREGCAQDSHRQPRYRPKPASQTRCSISLMPRGGQDQQQQAGHEGIGGRQPAGELNTGQACLAQASQS